jgi:imidazolonepropionase-like amidohydrolase
MELTARLQRLGKVLAALFVSLAGVARLEAQSASEFPPKTAILCGKAITCAEDMGEEQVVDQALILIRDGKIESIGKARDLKIPAGYELLDYGSNWVVPGLIDLHSHIGHTGLFGDWNDSVFPVNPGLRVASTLESGNPFLYKALAGGVTVVLYLPGSGNNMSGSSVLLKTHASTFGKAVMRNPASLKIAQAGNPERWGMRQDRSFMNWQIRSTLRKGKAYGKAWEEHLAGNAPEPQFDPNYETIRALARGDISVSAHTQFYQVELMSVNMIKKELGLGLFIAHGTFDGWKVAKIAQDAGVPAILGPRSVQWNSRGGWGVDTDGSVRGVAAEYQAMGHKSIGFNTDAVNPNWTGGPHTQELSLQAAMGVRYGLNNDRIEALRGLTIVPAMAAGVSDRIGSLEVGKDADLLILDGDPTDPRNRIRFVFIDGERVYSQKETPTLW